MTKFYPAAVGDTTRTRVRQSLRREYGAGVLTDCATLQEAVLAWHKLAPEQKIRATVKVIGGRVYIAREIERLHYGPKPGVTVSHPARGDGP